MKVVVADTSPINYLVLIECVDLLYQLYGRVVIPVEVLHELTAPGVPPQVARWMQGQPAWMETRAAPASLPLPIVANKAGLDAGEEAAIRLALMEPDSLLLVDDAAGRSVATQLAIPNTGTVGVLLAGSKEGLVDLQTSLDRLRKTNFRISQSLIDKLLAGEQSAGRPAP